MEWPALSSPTPGKTVLLSSVTQVISADPVDLSETGVPSLDELAEQIAARRVGFDPAHMFFVTLIRDTEHLTLVLDAGWVRLLQDTEHAAPQVLDSIVIPSTALAAILPCWPGDFMLVSPFQCHWTERYDGVLLAHVDDLSGTRR